MTVSSETLRSISRQERLNDVLVRSKSPFLFTNGLVPTNRLDEQRPARTDQIKRLGDCPGVIRVTADGAAVKVAAKAEDTELLLGAYPKLVGATAASRAPNFEREASYSEESS
jgi:hypothetical protein